MSVPIDPTRTAIEWAPEGMIDNGLAEAAAMNYALPWALVNMALDDVFTEATTATREDILAALTVIVERFNRNEYTGF